MNKTLHLSLKQWIPMTLGMVPMLVALAVDGMLNVATVLLRGTQSWETRPPRRAVRRSGHRSRPSGQPASRRGSAA
jgi:hypothetical protein